MRSGLSCLYSVSRARGTSNSHCADMICGHVRYQICSAALVAVLSPVTMKSLQSVAVCSSKICRISNGSAAAGSTIGIASNTVEDCGSLTVIVPAAMAVPVAAGKTRMRAGLMPWLPIPARVQPDVPRQLVFAPVEVSVSSQTGWTLKEFMLFTFRIEMAQDLSHQENRCPTGTLPQETADEKIAMRPGYVSRRSLRKPRS
jgi:hypothetical protein